MRREVEDAFFAALELPEAEREAFLLREYLQEPELRAEVESLLRAHGAAGTAFLDPRGSNASSRETLPAGSDAPRPSVIGHYRIVRLLGEGGMGSVYEVEQQQPRRTVALKLIKPGLAGTRSLRRFQLEAEALGRLQHPGIAQIYEAGMADGGWPYFAMELIRGELLLKYAEKHHLNARQRLQLMAKICEAVHHAHQRGIIHRDLKPGNILVDESGQPKVLDFGVARVTDSDTQATRQTDVGQII